MKKRMTYLILAIFVALITVGCPPADISSPPEGEPPNPQTLGQVVISGNIFDSSKLLTQTQIGDLLKTKIDYIKIWFGEDTSVPPSQTNSYPDPFVVEIDSAGNYYSQLSIIPAHYSIYTEAYDSGDKRLFVDQLLLVVLSGQTTDLNILFGLVDLYLFEFQISDFPGNWGNTGDAVIVTGDGSNYFISYVKSGVALNFSAWLPINFDGFTSYMDLTDLDGVTYSTDLNFDIFDAVDGLFPIPFAGGVVDINIGFEY
ncbi:MAG: hypothetical protein Q7K65_03580 [Candidatus Buchananbacteria bacterium]|nr:hypothetical protein [Candidatus Buchananbacteria bacterium]